MKRSIAFTGTNYPILNAIVASKRAKGVKGNNINNHVNSILQAHFKSAEAKIAGMQLNEQIEVSELDYDTIKAVRASIKDKEFQTLNMGDGVFIIRRTK